MRKWVYRLSSFGVSLLRPYKESQCLPVLERLEHRVLLSAAVDYAASLNSALFIKNAGQWADESVRFVNNGKGASIALTDTGATFRLRREVAGVGEADMALPGGERETLPTVETRQFSASFVNAETAALVGQERSASTFNYAVGDMSTHRSGVAGFGSVRYEELYAGIDMVTWGLKDNLKYEFHVAPGADYSQIQIRYEGIQNLTLAADGSLVINVADGWAPITDDAPYIYQNIGGQRVAVTGEFHLLKDNTFAFNITGSFEKSIEMVIDPTLEWSSYLGGSSGDVGENTAIDSFGNAWVTGSTYSSEWAVGGFDTIQTGGSDAFVAKINADGTLAWSSYLGGDDSDFGEGIALDASGNAFVTGQSSSSGWAVGGFDTSYNGGDSDAFIAKINANGTLAWSSFLGGSDSDDGRDLAVDHVGDIWVTGVTRSTDFASVGVDTIYNGGSSDTFVAKLNANGAQIWSSYVGDDNGDDEGSAIAVDSGGNAWVLGYTYSIYLGYGPFAVEIATDGAQLSSRYWRTIYTGGSYSRSVGSDIAVDGSGNVWIAGISSGRVSTYSFSNSFLRRVGDTFESDMNVAVLGDGANGLAVDAGGNVWVTGRVSEEDATVHGFDTTFNGGEYDAFIAKFNANGTLVWSSYLGGNGQDEGQGIAIAAGKAWVTGNTNSSGWALGSFDTTYNGGDGDAFIVKISDTSAEPGLSIASSNSSSAFGETFPKCSASLSR